MKKHLMLCCLFAATITGTCGAQVVKNEKPGNFNNPFLAKVEIIASAVVPGKDLVVRLSLDKDKQKHTVLSFTADKPLVKVEVIASKGAVSETSTTNYPGNTSGQFALDAPAYAGFEQYIFKFYTQSGMEWTATVKRVKQVIKKLPKQIQN